MRWLGWALLGTLLTFLILAALIHDRAGRPAFTAGEATRVMQAESLIHDLDLAYTRRDFDRFLLGRRGDPADLDLVSGSGGRRITFDAPFPYALWMAPFLARWPGNGFAIANAVLLAWVGLFAARTLAREGGAKAPWQVAVLIFASALFAETFRADGGLFLFAVTLAAVCVLARESRRRDGFAGRPFRFAGALLAIPAASDLLLAVLLGAAFWALPPGGRRARARRHLALGAAAMLVAIAGVCWLAGGGLPWGGEDLRFTPASGYPEVDFPASQWPDAVEERAASAAWTGDPELRLWSLVDLLAGRESGLLPYFPALALIVLAGSLRGDRRPLALGALVFAALVVVLRPFDVSGGFGIVNGLFLPVFGALWPVLDARRAAWRAGLGAALGLGLGALFLGDLWRDPGAPPRLAGRGSSHVTAAAESLLPYETTQRRSPAGAVEEHGGLAVRVLAGDAWFEARHGRFLLAGGRAELLIGSRGPLEALLVDFPGGVPEHLEVRGAKIDAGFGGGSPGAVRGVIRIEPRLRRRHAVPWSRQRLHLYRLSFELPDSGRSLAFGLAGEPEGPRNGENDV